MMPERDESDPQPPATPQPRRRIGRFIVGHATFACDWRTLLPLFAKVVPVRAESLFHLDGIEYLALCEDFDEIDLHETPPFYDVACRYTERGEPVFIFTRREEAGGGKHPTSNTQHPIASAEHVSTESGSSPLPADRR